MLDFLAARAVVCSAADAPSAGEPPPRRAARPSGRAVDTKRAASSVVEHPPFKRLVPGSIPGRPTIVASRRWSGHPVIARSPRQPPVSAREPNSGAAHPCRRDDGRATRSLRARRGNLRFPHASPIPARPLPSRRADGRATRSWRARRGNLRFPHASQFRRGPCPDARDEGRATRSWRARRGNLRFPQREPNSGAAPALSSRRWSGHPVIARSPRQPPVSAREPDSPAARPQPLSRARDDVVGPPGHGALAAATSGFRTRAQFWRGPRPRRRDEGRATRSWRARRGNLRFPHASQFWRGPCPRRRDEGRATRSWRARRGNLRFPHASPILGAAPALTSRRWSGHPVHARARRGNLRFPHASPICAAPALTSRRGSGHPGMARSPRNLRFPPATRSRDLARPAARLSVGPRGRLLRLARLRTAGAGELLRGRAPEQLTHLRDHMLRSRTAQRLRRAPLTDAAFGGMLRRSPGGAAWRNERSARPGSTPCGGTCATRRGRSPTARPSRRRRCCRWPSASAPRRPSSASCTRWSSIRSRTGIRTRWSACPSPARTAAATGPATPSTNTSSSPSGRPRSTA